MAKKKRKKLGLPPGSLIYTGRKIIATPNITLVQFNETDLKQQQSKDRIPEPEAGNFVNWFDIRGLNNVPFIEAIGRKFHIHPLALEDILNPEQRPKIEEYDETVFLIAQALSWDAENFTVRSEQVAFFTTDQLVISFQEDKDDLFASIRERLATATGKIRKRGADYLTYALLDFLVDHYYLVLDQIEQAIEDAEKEVLTMQDTQTKRHIHRLKLATLRMRKASSPTREAINRLYKIEHPAFKDETAIFVRDLHDHIAQITDTIETYRDMINGVYDLYLSELNVKMNNIIQVLTIISTIFIPLTFLVGVYGMNFAHMPELEWRYGYFAVWGLMILIFIGQLFYFRRRKWI
jgi:magnesium transporter